MDTEYTLQQLHGRWGFSVEAIKKWCQSGRLTAHKQGRRWLVTHADMLAFEAGGDVKAPVEAPLEAKPGDVFPWAVGGFATSSRSAANNLLLSVSSLRHVSDDPRARRLADRAVLIAKQMQILADDAEDLARQHGYVREDFGD